MSEIAALLRPYWAEGLNEISGVQIYTLQEWFPQRKYAVMNDIQDKNIFQLSLTEPDKFLSSLAFDCNRMASASFETMFMIDRNSKISRSFAWLIIKSYYAAFFAAHSILRVLGESCSQLEQSQINHVNTIARLYSTDNGIKVVSGYYLCEYSTEEVPELQCKNLKAGGGGSHELFWKIFLEKIRLLRNDILTSHQTVLLTAQIVASKLSEISNNLCLQGCNGGNWLSKMRNDINYRHKLDAWFPSTRYSKGISDELYSNYNQWLGNPLDIELSSPSLDNLSVFMNTCNFIVGLCRVLVEDMSSRCSRGNSYLTYGPIRLLNTMSNDVAA